MVTRRKFLVGMAATSALLAGCGSLGATGSSSDSIVFGVSVPLTGNNAEYGKIWQKGFGLALDEINGAGGVHGRKVELVYEDSQSDPKQTVPIARKFVADSRILAELGDFSSPASMAASPVYEKGKMVQLGFTNSHPKFTLGGEFMYSTSSTQQVSAAYLAQVSIEMLKAPKQAVLYLDTDWGHVSEGIYVDSAKKAGAQLALQEPYLSTEKDFRSLLLKVRNANPDVLALISYYNDAALIVQQARAVGVKAKLLVSGSAYSPRFLSLAGDAANGSFLTTDFFPTDPSPAVQKFTTAYQKRYNEIPDSFAAGAYDAVKVLAWAVEKGGPDRVAIQQALRTGTDIPSVVHGPFKFGPDRRVNSLTQRVIQVQNNQFQIYKG
jgi:branched-chain amino acid transport system substrate-binding protein